MPNWCSNKLYITGDRVAIADFIKRVTNTPEQQESRKQTYDILNNLYPCPEELTNTMSGSYGNDTEKQAELEVKQATNLAKYGARDWYDWCNNNWGTKWGDSDTYLNGAEGDKQIEFGFESAWSPPIQGISHIATMFPTLKFALSYEELGMGFFGLATFEADGDYLDDCHEVEDLDGYSKIDFDDEDSYIEVVELVVTEQEKLLEGAGW
jgi:hypothetical protein